MSEKNMIDVTPNLKKCLEILLEAINQLPSGDFKDKAEAALQYMSRTFEGEPQPMDGEGCPPGVVFIPT